MGSTTYASTANGASMMAAAQAELARREAARRLDPDCSDRDGSTSAGGRGGMPARGSTSSVLCAVGIFEARDAAAHTPPPLRTVAAPSPPATSGIRAVLDSYEALEAAARAPPVLEAVVGTPVAEGVRGVLDGYEAREAAARAVGPEEARHLARVAARDAARQAGGDPERETSAKGSSPRGGT
ncbi:hypothetical protein MMPV_006706 [Pyropia vietnamensis]